MQLSFCSFTQNYSYFPLWVVNIKRKYHQNTSDTNTNTDITVNHDGHYSILYNYTFTTDWLMSIGDWLIFILIICNKIQRYRTIQRQYTDNCMRLTFIKQNMYLNCTAVRYRCQYKYYICLTLYYLLETITFLNCISIKATFIWYVEQYLETRL